MIALYLGHNGRCLWQKIYAPPDIEKNSGPDVRFRARPLGVRMGESYTKEEVEMMVAAAVEKSMNGILMTAITETVHCAVTKAMREYKHDCVLDLDDKELVAMQTLVDVIKATGHGDVGAGVEEIRENHSFMSKLRKRCEKASETVVHCMIKSLTTLLLLAVGIGVGYLIMGGRGSAGQ